MVFLEGRRMPVSLAKHGGAHGTELLPADQLAHPTGLEGPISGDWLHSLHSGECLRAVSEMGIPVVGKLAVLWFVKKVFVLGAVKAYGPGKLYRRTRSWNRYLLKGAPGVRHGGDRALGFLFRLPDMILGKNNVLQGPPTGPLSRSASVAGSAAVVSKQQVQRERWLSKAAQGSYASSPLMQRARLYKQKVYSKLPRASDALQRGKLKAGTLMTRGVLASRQVAGILTPRDFMMDQVRHIRRSWSLSLPVPSP